MDTFPLPRARAGIRSRDAGMEYESPQRPAAVSRRARKAVRRTPRGNPTVHGKMVFIRAPGNESSNPLGIIGCASSSLISSPCLGVKNATASSLVFTVSGKLNSTRTSLLLGCVPRTVVTLNVCAATEGKPSAARAMSLPATSIFAAASGLLFPAG